MQRDSETDVRHTVKTAGRLVTKFNPEGESHTAKTGKVLMTTTVINNGFGNSKSLSEQINEVVNGKGSRRDKIEALIKLGIRENEISFVLPVIPRVPSQPRFTFTFGVEIECVMPRMRFEAVANATGVNYEFEHYNHTDNRDHFKFVTDGSLSRSSGREGDPIECVSPVLDGTKAGFDKLQACCEALNAAGAYVNRSTGLHVHIGAENMTGEQYVNVFKNYKALEAIIDTFMAPSRRDNEYAATLRDHNFDWCNSVEDVRSEMRCDRYHKVNPMSYERHRTIEFRQHQGTTNFKKIQMWVRFVSKLVAYSMNNVITACSSIDEIPFLNASEKAYFNSRKAAFEAGREREAA